MTSGTILAFPLPARPALFRQPDLLDRLLDRAPFGLILLSLVGFYRPMLRWVIVEYCRELYGAGEVQ